MLFSARQRGSIGVVTGALMLSACSSMGSAHFENLDTFQQQLLGDMPLPPATTINNAQSLILGSGASWAGRVVIHIPHGTSDTFTFFRDQYPATGWTGISSIKAKNSILVFTKQERTVTVEISEAGSLSSGTQVTLTAAPKGIISPTPQVAGGSPR
jgi:hypothetical protein